MTVQLDIFIHQRENNATSEAHLNENKEKFTDQCKKVLELLRSGVRLTTINAPSYGILSLPRRLKDLRDYNGVHINETWVRDQEGRKLFKEWFL